MEQRIVEKSTGKPKLIVLPLQPGPGHTYDGIGLGVHFFLGNIVATHTGLKEFWFGWRIKKLFSEKEKLSAYCRGETPPLAIARLGKEQKIRYWLRGRVQTGESQIKTTLRLTDVENGGKDWTTELKIDPVDKLIRFQNEFITWLNACGLSFPQNSAATTPWPENIAPNSLDLLGQDLETYYCHSTWGDKASLDPELFGPAVATAPSSFLAHDLKGWILYKTKQYQAAEKSFETAISINPAGVGALSGLMWCAVYMGNQKKACHWATAKADIRGESREAARASVEKRMKKAALHAQ